MRIISIYLKDVKIFILTNLKNHLYLKNQFTSSLLNVIRNKYTAIFLNKVLANLKILNLQKDGTNTNWQLAIEDGEDGMKYMGGGSGAGSGGGW